MTTPNTIPDSIFDEALVRLLQGESIESIVADHKIYQQELVGLLSVAQTGMSVPKLEVPAPYKSYRFADKVAATAGFTAWMQYFRVAVIPISLVIALLGGRTIVNATANSLPGDKLYTLKRATEQAQLTLTTDQDKVASLHVEFMQKRIDEVKKAADSGNEATETLAIAELKSQSDKTFAEAGPVATANAISKQDSSLLNNLVAVNQQQKDVLASLSISSDTDSAKTIATSALEDNKKNDQTLAKIIATVNDQALADMPNKVSVTGDVSFYNGAKITVEKNVFNINSHTVLTSIDGKSILDAEHISGRVTVIGTRMDNGQLDAKQILLLAANDQDGSVKGEVDVNPVQTPDPKPIITPRPIVTPIIKPIESTPTVEPNPPVEPTKASGSFITEPTSQQYSQ
jgi:Domain of unknown function (DUF5667)